MIEIKEIPKKGRGVVAQKIILKETLIEAAPVASFSKKQWELMKKTDIFKYCFVIPSEYEKHKNVDGHIVFGLSSFCNHSNNPNAYIKWIQNEIGLWVHLIAE